MIKSFRGKNPEISSTAFVAETAVIIGDVHIGQESSIWFGAVLRGDSDAIRIGDRSNVQDNAVVHVDPGFATTIGNDCIIGHLALVHGATIGNNVLVGMHSTILNGAVVGDFSIIGAGALVTGNTQIPPYSLVIGSPAKVVKILNEQQIEAIRKNAVAYVKLSREYLEPVNNLTN
ncbi:MAG: gamma carbonic anhydrase family protein [Flavobacteriales bacterium]|nr:gamma carbonic anhydrase family protein [Flavobacteriales bacterium]